MNLLEGYGADNPTSKSQGMKQLMADVIKIKKGKAQSRRNRRNSQEIFVVLHIGAIMKTTSPMAKVPTVTHQMKKVSVKNGKPQFYEPEIVQKARSKLSDVGPYRPEKPMQGAVRLVVKWCFPLSGAHLDGEYRISKHVNNMIISSKTSKQSEAWVAARPELVEKYG